MSAWNTAFLLCVYSVPGYHVLEAINFIRIIREGRKMAAETIVELDCYNREFGFGGLRFVGWIVPLAKMLLSLAGRWATSSLPIPSIRRNDFFSAWEVGSVDNLRTSFFRLVDHSTQGFIFLFVRFTCSRSFPDAS